MSDPTPPSPSMAQIMALLVDIKKSTYGADKHRDATDGKISQISSSIEDMSLTIAELEKRLAIVEQRPVNVSNQPTDETSKQEIIRKNVSIYGVQKTENEDLNKIAAAIGVALNINITRDDYSNLYRTGKNGELIILSFTSFRKKLELLAARKAKRSLLSSELNILSIAEHSIYINNQLTPYFGKIFSMGRKAVSEKKLAACWVAFNCVCVKKCLTDDRRFIKSLQDMETICGSPPTTTTPAVSQLAQHSQSSSSAAPPPLSPRAPKRKAARALNTNNKVAKASSSKGQLTSKTKSKTSQPSNTLANDEPEGPTSKDVQSDIATTT